MLSGFYTAASGILIQQRKLNVLTNNIANARTPGYRAERVVTETFDHELLTRIEGGGQNAIIGSGSPIRIVREVPVNFDPAALEDTGRPFDLAINGEGFFNIAQAAQLNEQGEEIQAARTLLTRNGCFDIDDEGFLILPGVGRVLGKRGEIEIEGSYFTVTPQGEVYNNRGRRVDTLLLTRPTDQAVVEKINNGLYRVDDPDNNMVEVDTLVRQGLLERNNIDINREYALVMEAQRAFQSCSQALKIVDAMNQKASTQIAAL